MPTLSVPPNAKQLLEIVKQLSPDQFQEFRRQFMAWQQQNGQPGESDIALLRSARTRLPARLNRRLQRLAAKSEEGSLTPAELAEYQSLAQRAEQLDATRAEALAEFVQRHGKAAVAKIQQISGEGGTDGP